MFFTKRHEIWEFESTKPHCALSQELEHNLGEGFAVWVGTSLGEDEPKLIVMTDEARVVRWECAVIPLKYEAWMPRLHIARKPLPGANPHDQETAPGELTLVAVRDCLSSDLAGQIRYDWREIRVDFQGGKKKVYSSFKETCDAIREELADFDRAETQKEKRDGASGEVFEAEHEFADNTDGADD